MKAFLMGLLALTFSLAVQATEDRQKEDSHFDEPDYVETYESYEDQYQSRSDYGDSEYTAETEDRDPHLDYGPTDGAGSVWDSEVF